MFEQCILKMYNQMSDATLVKTFVMPKNKYINWKLNKHVWSQIKVRRSYLKLYTSGTNNNNTGNYDSMAILQQLETSLLCSCNVFKYKHIL